MLTSLKEANTGVYTFEEEDPKIVGFMLKYMYTGRLDIETPPPPPRSLPPPRSPPIRTTGLQVNTTAYANAPMPRSSKYSTPAILSQSVSSFSSSIIVMWNTANLSTVGSRYIPSLVPSILPLGPPSRQFIPGAPGGQGPYVTPYAPFPGRTAASNLTAHQYAMGRMALAGRSMAPSQTSHHPVAAPSVVNAPPSVVPAPARARGSAVVRAYAYNLMNAALLGSSQSGLAAPSIFPPSAVPNPAPAGSSLSSVAPPAQAKDYSDGLKTAVSVYILADQYDVSPLRDLACKKYAVIAAEAYNSDAFISSLAHIHDNTIELNIPDPLRKIAFEAAGRNMNKLVDSPLFQQLCLERGDIAVAIMKASGVVDSEGSKKRGGGAGGDGELDGRGSKRLRSGSPLFPGTHSPQCTGIDGIIGVCARCDGINKWAAQDRR